MKQRIKLFGVIFIVFVFTSNIIFMTNTALQANGIGEFNIQYVKYKLANEYLYMTRRLLEGVLPVDSNISLWLASYQYKQHVKLLQKLDGNEIEKGLASFKYYLGFYVASDYIPEDDAVKVLNDTYNTIFRLFLEKPIDFDSEVGRNMAIPLLASFYKKHHKTFDLSVREGNANERSKSDEIKIKKITALVGILKLLGNGWDKSPELWKRVEPNTIVRVAYYHAMIGFLSDTILYKLVIRSDGGSKISKYDLHLVKYQLYRSRFIDSGLIQLLNNPVRDYVERYIFGGWGSKTIAYILVNKYGYKKDKYYPDERWEYENYSKMQILINNAFE